MFLQNNRNKSDININNKIWKILLGLGQRINYNTDKKIPS